MDPLSIMASIAGVAAAGTALSKAIYELVSSTRGASAEMADIARNIADLSIILGELRRVLRDGAELCNRRYLRRIKSAMRRISSIHRDIHHLMEDAQGFKSLKWRFKRSEVQKKLTRIESHKTAVNLMLNILVLAISTKKLADPHTSQITKSDKQEDITLLRQQSENLAYAACRSLADLPSDQTSDNEQEQSEDGSSDQRNESDSQTLVHVPRDTSDDTANWLFDLVFSSYVQSCMDHNIDKSASSDSDDDTQDQPATDDERINKSRSVAMQSPSAMQLAIYQPGATSSLVKELLADWTVLTEKEIESTTNEPPSQQQGDDAKTSKASKREKDFVRLKDAVGRHFKFPFYRVETYEGFKKLLDAGFRDVEMLGPHVQKGHFDILSPDEDIILPEIWEDLIQPGMALSMTMWPINEPVPPKMASAPEPPRLRGIIPPTLPPPGWLPGRRSTIPIPEFETIVNPTSARKKK